MDFEDKYKNLVMASASMEADKIKLNAKMEMKEEENKKLNDVLEAKEKEIEKLKQEITELKPVREIVLKLEAEKFTTNLLSSRKILPSQKDYFLNFYASHGKTESEKMVDAMPKLDENLFSELSSSEDNSEGNITTDEEKLIAEMMGTSAFITNEKKGKKEVK